MTRNEKFKVAISLKDTTASEIARRLEIPYPRMNNLLKSKTHTKESLEMLAKEIGIDLICQFRRGDTVITADTFPDMVNKLMTESGTSYAKLGIGSRQNASIKAKHERMEESTLQEIARACGAIYEERFIVDGVELQ